MRMLSDARDIVLTNYIERGFVKDCPLRVEKKVVISKYNVPSHHWICFKFLSLIGHRFIMWSPKAMLTISGCAGRSEPSLNVPASMQVLLCSTFRILKKKTLRVFEAEPSLCASIDPKTLHLGTKHQMLYLEPPRQVSLRHGSFEPLYYGDAKLSQISSGRCSRSNIKCYQIGIKPRVLSVRILTSTIKLVRNRLTGQ